MSNDSAHGRPVGTHPGSFSRGEYCRWTSWAQTDSDPLCARSGTVDSQHRRAMAHAAAELPELQNCASAFSELVMIVSSHGLFKLTGYLALKRVYIRLFNDGKDSTSVSFPLQPLKPHNARTRARARPRPQSMGGKFFRNHTNFHHAHYSKDHLVRQIFRHSRRTSVSKFRCESNHGTQNGKNGPVH